MKRKLTLEQLESRQLLSGANPLGCIRCYPFDTVVANTRAPSGLSPATIRSAYGITAISFNGIVGDGTGQTIAIVDAGDDPNLASDLGAFDAQFGLPAPPSFTKLNEYGNSSPLPSNQGWGVEESLDVEWAHAIAPGASIVLVEANSSSLSDLVSTAVPTAAKLPGVSVVSMSFGTEGELDGENFYDSAFQTPAGHNGVTFVASTGDSGAAYSGYPAFSPDVVAAGGTTLKTSSGSYVSESGWSDGGGGTSLYEAKPSYQSGLPYSGRSIPDVSFDADPNSGVAVYDSYDSPSSPWIQVGGTSLAAPCWAALVAIADQGRAINNLGTLDGQSQTLPDLYGLYNSPATYKADFHDVTNGNNGNPAGVGYDLATGIGSPIANQLAPALGLGSTPRPTTYTVTNLDSSGPGSLPEAVAEANSQASNPAGSLIEFAAGVSGQITLSSTLALAETDGPEVIVGPGASIVTVSGNNAVEVFQVNDTASLSGLTISGGSSGDIAEGCGGGITNNGTLTITNCTISGNTAESEGGGIYNGYKSTLAITGCTISGNSAGDGGGILNSDQSTLTITDSTIAYNAAGNGGGLYNGEDCTLTVTSSTVSGNSASSYAGGIYNSATCWLTVINSTIAGNAAGDLGSGISNVGNMLVVNGTIAYNSDGGLDNYGTPGSSLVTLNNTIVARNSAISDGSASDITGVVSPTSAYNLIGTGGTGELVNGVNGNIVGVANPELGTLADNGGPTQTIALLTGSPAINSGSNALALDASGNALSCDQRGASYPRILYDTVDIGAFESMAATPVIAWANPANISYGTALSSRLDATASYEGVPVSGTFVYTASDGTILDVGAILNAGQDQVLTVTFTPTDTVDYTIASMSVTINVSKANPTIIVNGYTVAYDGQPHTATGTATGIGGVALSGLVLSGTTHTIAASYSDDWSFVDATGNYNNATGAVADTINKTEPNLAVTDAGGTYNGSAYPAIANFATIEGVPVTLDYKQNGNDLGATAPVNAGTYQVSASFAGSPDYAASSSPPVQFKIAQATPVLSVTDAGGVYIGMAYAATPNAPSIEGVAVTLDYQQNGNDLGSIAPIHAGTYMVTANFGGSTNYAPSSSQPLPFSISAARLTITANAASMVYGAGLPALAASYSGFVGGDTSASLEISPAVSTSATTAIHVGSYPITVSGASDPDYTITYKPGTLTITPAILVITATNATKVYGAGLPALTVGYQGFVNGDTAASLTKPPLLRTATASSHVLLSGTPIVASGAVDPDYTMKYVSGTLLITPAALKIKASNATKVYGASMPVLTVSYGGLVNGDTAASLSVGPALTTSALASSPVLPGGYVMSVSGASDPDYAIQYQPGTLFITPAPLTITANSITMVQGTNVPPLSASYAGLVNGDSAASLTTQPTLTTPATAASPPGTYPILVKGASSPNYMINYASGIVVVMPLPVSLIGVSVQSIRLGKSTKATQVIVLQFSGSLSPGDAQATSSYNLTTISTSKKHPARAVAIAQAEYNAASKTVTLITRKPLVLNPPLKITYDLLNSYGGLIAGQATLGKSGITFHAGPKA